MLTEIFPNFVWPARTGVFLERKEISNHRIYNWFATSDASCFISGKLLIAQLSPAALAVLYHHDLCLSLPNSVQFGEKMKKGKRL